ncbi:ATPase, OSCP/delta subunit [Dillenia turbinata]|uniref:ATPase, OSCP/delta subunit n=1 Tax=Dillenia turbinata TaxID=194707 RepID=A0AAN8VJA5_9MAGN
MALANRIRSSLPLLQNLARSSNSIIIQQQSRSLIVPTLINSEFSRNYATASAAKEQKVKVPLTLFGASGNYASALYIASVKANALDKVETEILDLVEAAKKSPTFSQFMKDLSVNKDIRVKAVMDVSDHCKFSEITKNFLALLAENGRLQLLETIAKRFSELTMAHRGEVKAVVTSVIPLPPEEEKDLRETLQDVIGKGGKVKLEQKIDPSILGGLIVQFGQKVFDMSIRTRAKQMERFLRDPVNLDNL